MSQEEETKKAVRTVLQSENENDLPKEKSKEIREFLKIKEEDNKETQLGKLLLRGCFSQEAQQAMISAYLMETVNLLDKPLKEKSSTN